ncbi:PREDICTED: multiple C2 and transmembrane domain-containing protein 2-like [Fragaria vesca subsp. vesca]|uniref:multiple C2 and transmembrane domain-containing protein 2-like n=1 Tax=Fragaria vesca subsp. vesca TaxID=101020 RepID=UPI0002C34FC2|nr:PREDICTED: multiple C2 and transmembrane domain-containing protein 2-like [Fragaria vesca subsp. vesca]
MTSHEDFSVKETRPNISSRRISTGPVSSFDLVEHMQYLYVRVVKARELPLPCDPYVELKLGNYTGTTMPFQKTPNPVWNQVFAFSKDRIQDITMEILVKDRAVVVDGQGHPTIGKFSFIVPEAPMRIPPDSALAPEWYRLEGLNGVKIRGELMLSFWFGTQADEAFSEAWHADVAAVSGDFVSTTRSKVYLSPRLWYLRVNVIEAQDLILKINNNKVEASDLLVKAGLGNLFMRSRVSKNKSVNPEWNEDLMFVAAEPFDDPLVVSVVELVNRKEEHCIGMCVIPLSDVDRRIGAAPPANKWYNLSMMVEGQQKDVKFASKLHMRISLDGGYHVLDEPTNNISDLLPSSKLLWRPPIGVLELGILNATGLSPIMNNRPSDQVWAYCVAKYGTKWVRTRTIVDSLEPKWNEQYTWEVYDPCTVITIGVFDNGCGNNKLDLCMGKVRIRLSTLETDRVYTNSYPLVVLTPFGLKKIGEIQLAVRFSCSSLLNLLNQYAQPLLPKLHYILPLSIYQLASLRHQAAYIIATRLSRAEPPLRKEVVDYMLDANAHLWSIRRSRANFNRIIKLFDGIVALYKCFEKIRKWTNPIVTGIVHIIFLVLLFFPGVILPTMFFYFCGLGIWRFRRRPRQIAYIDTELSTASNVTPEDLAEEFDPFPSRKNSIDDLRRRYDLLRSLGGRIQTVLGDIATLGERVQSLVSWRDPRATFMFVLFSFVAGVIAYLVPFRILAFVAFIYELRHPSLRIDLPSFPRNFLRRMPARSDTMI